MHPCRLAGGGQSGRAASAEKALAKLQEERVTKPFETRKRSFRFPPVESMGERVATIDKLTHGYNGRLLFENQSLLITKGDRIAIIGPNGAGKSTLLRLLMGTEAAQSGRVALGEHSIVPNYYEQNQAEALDLKLTVLETLTHAADNARLDEMKALLGRMMFSRAAFDKKVAVLSGGEKARLALAKFMLTQGTLLVLDEPTNHLDIPSKEMLEEAVCAFEGAVIAVSHDRYFLRKIATRVVTVEGTQLVDYTGDYDYYLQVCSGTYSCLFLIKSLRCNRPAGVRPCTFRVSYHLAAFPNPCPTPCTLLPAGVPPWPLLSLSARWPAVCVTRCAVQNNAQEAAKMKIKQDKEKKIKQSNIKAKSKMSKAEKKAAKRLKAQDFELRKAGTNKSKK